MTRKSLVRKLAKKIHECELIHQNPSSVEEKARAEKEIFRISKQIESMDDGFEIMLEVDEEVQKLLASK